MIGRRMRKQKLIIHDNYSLQVLLVRQEKEILINNIRRKLNSLSLDKLKEINKIIKMGEGIENNE
jgi:hypothetical protein